MRNDEHIIGVVRLIKIPVESLQKCAEAVVDIGAGFTIRDAIIKVAEVMPVLYDLSVYVLFSKMAPILLTEARIFKDPDEIGFNAFADVLKSLASPVIRG